MFQYLVDLCKEYLETGKVDVSYYNFRGHNVICLSDKDKIDFEISPDAGKITVSKNCESKEFDALVKLCKEKLKEKQNG